MFAQYKEIFNANYKTAYPVSFHLKDQLWYYEIKYSMILEVLNYIERTKKETLTLCDVWGWYWYDDTFIKNVVHHYFPHVTITVDLFDPDINFYHGTTHNKQPDIEYHEESFLTIDMLLYKDKYDIIVCSEVIEHLWWAEQEICFVNFNRILKKWGILLLTTPNWSSILKVWFWLLQWKKNNYDTFMSEFNHRYAHIGIPTLFQILGLFVRKWFTVQSIVPSTFVSSTLVSPLSIWMNILFKILIWLNLFLSTDNLYIVTKNEEIDETKWYNTLSA